MALILERHLGMFKVSRHTKFGSFFVKTFKRQTHRQHETVWTHYLPGYADSNNIDCVLRYRMIKNCLNTRKYLHYGNIKRLCLRRNIEVVHSSASSIKTYGLYYSRASPIHPVQPRWTNINCFKINLAFAKDTWITPFCKKYTLFFSFQINVLQPWLLVFKNFNNQKIWRQFSNSFLIKNINEIFLQIHS